VRAAGEDIDALIGMAESLGETLECFVEIPSAVGNRGSVVPRIFVVAQRCLSDTKRGYSTAECVLFARRVQTATPFFHSELKAFPQALRLSAFLSLGKMLDTIPPGEAFRNKDIPDLIAGLKMLGSMDEDAVVAELLSFEGVLEKDPSGIYPQMDCHSKNACRQAVERLSMRYGVSPAIICNTALALAARAPVAIDARLRLHSHVGFYLLDEGVHILLERLGLPRAYGHSVPRSSAGAVTLYFCLTALLWAPAGVLAVSSLPNFWPALIFIPALGVLASQCALALMDTYTNQRPQFHRLPALDFSKGIPDKFRTVVAIPVVLLDVEQVETLTRTMERHYSLTAGVNVSFVLLTDFPDDGSPSPGKAQQQLLEICSQSIFELNQRPAYVDRRPFVLLHRDHIFCRTQRKWIGWERKRGKILDLASYIRCGVRRFSRSAGNPDQLTGAQYIVVLDEDTEITKYSIEQLVGAHAHPLNHPYVEGRTRTLKRGFGILQPSVVVAQATEHVRAAKRPGFVRDFCQDAFGETPFCGKGIIHIETFAALVEDVLPEQRILSHDIVEGGLACTGAVPDILFREDPPSSYSLECRRRHRWIRGDWQNMIWLLTDCRQGRWSIPLFGAVLIFQTAGASLVPVAISSLLLAGTALHRFGMIEYLALLVAGPRILSSGGRMMRAAVFGRSVMKSLQKDLRKLCLQMVTLVACSAHGALIASDAVVRTAIRWWRGIGLLEWNTFVSSKRSRDRFSALRLYEHEWVAAALLFVLLTASGRNRGMGLPVLLLSWSFRPVIQAVINRLAGSGAR